VLVLGPVFKTGGDGVQRAARQVRCLCASAELRCDPGHLPRRLAAWMQN
jgi:hypothetical protein